VITCGVNPSADECLASGCCYHPTADNNVPSCYHDLYGKIGSGKLKPLKVCLKIKKFQL
jgi:hypothetical protein